MRNRVAFFGPAAAGLISGSVPTAADLLDLFDENVWKTRWPDDPYELQFPGIAALIVCCGAYPQEIARAGTTDLSGDQLTLGWGDFRREVWVPEIALKTVRRATSRTERAPGCECLFVRRDGTPMNIGHIEQPFVSFARRVRIGGYGLPVRLRTFFQDTIRNCDDAGAVAFLRRNAAVMRKARALGGEGEPSFAKLRKVVERTHPLGKLSRAMLHHVGAVDRAQPGRTYRELSPEAVADIAAARSERRFFYPQEAVDAVLAALNAGRHPREIAEHYGLPLPRVITWERRRAQPNFGSRRGGLRQRSNVEAFVAHVARHPDKTVHDVGEWMERRRGARIKTQDLRYLAKKEGLTFAPAHGALRRGAAPRRLRAHLRKHPEQTVDDVRTWVSSELGRELGRHVLYNFARVHGHTFASLRRTKTGGPNRARILDFIATHQEADAYAVIAFMKAEYGVDISLSGVRTFAREEGVTLVKRKTGRKPARSTRGNRAKLVEHIRTHPETDVYAAVEWIRTEHGEILSKWDVYSLARRNGLTLAKRPHGLKPVTG